MAHLIPKIEYGSAITTTIEFTYPPAKDDGERLDTKDRVTTALSGKRWTIVDEIEALRTVTLSFLTQAQLDALKTFFTSHAGRGRAFKYFEDKDNAAFVWYELNKNELKPRKVTSKGGAFLWEVTLDMRRIVDGAEGDTVTVSILNNQASPVAISGLNFDKDTTPAVIVFYEARRKTSTLERVTTGTLHLVYRQATGLWSVDNNPEFDTLGITFSMLSGQVQYMTDNMGGTGHVGSFSYKLVSLEHSLGA